MSNRDRLILLAANSTARVLIYAPLITLAVLFMPMALPALLLSASQPYLSNGARVFGQWLDRRFPTAMRPLNWVLDHWEKQISSKWWLHTAVITALIASLTIPAPTLLSGLFHKISGLPGIAGKVVGWMGGVIGGASGVWGQILPFAFLTALPLATKLSTTGFDKAFLWIGDHVPHLSGLDFAGVLSRRDSVRLDRQLQREERWLEKYGLPQQQPQQGGTTPPAPEPASPSPAPPIISNPEPTVPVAAGAAEVAVSLAGLGQPRVSGSLSRVAVASVVQIVQQRTVPPRHQELIGRVVPRVSAAVRAPQRPAAAAAPERVLG